MSPLPYEELAFASTSLGEISLRKRYDRLTRRWVHEVRLGDEYLMSSQFNATELALAHLGLADAPGEELRVLVAGLGLGFTAHAALKDPRTTCLVVVELVGAVIDWHVRELVPDTRGLAADPRCELVEADFFAMMRSGQCPQVDVLLVDIDHSPEVLLAEGHRDFYSTSGIRSAAAALSDQGVFALWSDDPPEDQLLDHLRASFTHARPEVVSFNNPITGGESACTVYVASRPLR